MMLQCKDEMTETPSEGIRILFGADNDDAQICCILMAPTTNTSSVEMIDEAKSCSTYNASSVVNKNSTVFVLRYVPSLRAHC